MKQMECCGAPQAGDEATGKYYTRHQRGGKGYQPSPPCQPARQCMNLRSRTAVPDDDVVVDGADDLMFYDRGVYGLAVARCRGGEEAHWKPLRKGEVVWLAHNRVAHTDRPLLRGPARLTGPQAVLHCKCVSRVRPAGATGSSLASYTRRGRGRR